MLLRTELAVLLHPTRRQLRLLPGVVHHLGLTLVVVLACPCTCSGRTMHHLPWFCGNVQRTVHCIELHDTQVSARHSCLFGRRSLCILLFSLCHCAPYLILDKSSRSRRRHKVPSKRRSTRCDPGLVCLVQSEFSRFLIAKHWHLLLHQAFFQSINAPLQPGRALQHTPRAQASTNWCRKWPIRASSGMAPRGTPPMQ
jgi:hypothetical protein